MDFQSLQTTKLGNVGEKYISEFAKYKNSKPYIPAYNASFPVDSICINEKGVAYSIEVKAKPRMLCYELTGFDLVDFKTYVNFSLPVYILFCDHITKSIYGAWTSELDKQPKTYLSGGIIAFPLTAMTIYRGLDYSEVKELEDLSQSKYYKK